MWYLVVPPVIVVASLFFLLWYLLRKKNDPVIAQKVLESEKEAVILFPGVKGFFLKGIEKLAYRFKVGLLRSHNVLNEFTQSVKKMRSRLEAATSSLAKSSGANVSVSLPKEIAEDSVTPTVDDTPVRTISYEVLAEPIVRKDRRERETAQFSPSEKKVLVPRPTISAAMTHPEKAKNTTRKESPKEESLIGRIARDPKDFTAYEELGDHYLEMGNITDAKECYRQVLKLSPVHRLVKIKIRRLEKLLTRGGE
jgi:tetratricopeptide (TPR) repeat protein